jgi:hypothetical protein
LECPGRVSGANSDDQSPQTRKGTEIIEALPPSQFRNSAIDMGRQIDAALAKTTED